MMTLVSIVVPVYQVEKYLDRCINSLICQTLKDIEIILVDDGSPDCSSEMCDEWAEKDSRIRVVHKKNGGLSSARNAGLKIATGKYVGFVDSDDTCQLDMYKKLADILEKYNCNFVMTDYNRILQDGSQYLKTLDIREGLYCKEDIRKDIYPSLIMGQNLDYGSLLSVWHCLYDREFLIRNQLWFDEPVKWSEDNIFSAFAGYKANSFYYLKGQGLYNYYQNPGTITTTYRKGSWDVYCLMNDHLHAFFDHVTDYDFSQQLKLHMIYYACNCLGQISNAPVSNQEKKQLMNKVITSSKLKEAFSNFQYPSEWPWKLKVQVKAIEHQWHGILRLIYGN